MGALGDLYLSRLKRRLLVGCLTTVIGGPIVCVGLLLLFEVVLPALESAQGTGQPVVLALAFACVVASLLAVPLVVAGAIVLRRARALDDVFTPFGLAGNPYMLVGREYHGSVAGRGVRVYLYRGPTVEVRLQVSTRASFQVAAKRAVSMTVARGLNAVPVPVDDRLLDEMLVFAPDHDWVRELLAYPAAVGAVHLLMTGGAGWSVIRQVDLQSGELVLHLYGSRGWLSGTVSDGEVRGWLEELLSLAAVVESLRPPQVATPATGVTAQSRQDTSRFLTWAVVAVALGLPLCAIVTFAVTLLLVSSS